MKNFKLIFKATDVFNAVLAEVEFNVQCQSFSNFSNFLEKEHKAFIEQMREQFSDKEHVYTNYYVRDITEQQVDVFI